MYVGDARLVAVAVVGGVGGGDVWLHLCLPPPPRRGGGGGGGGRGGGGGGGGGGGVCGGGPPRWAPGGGGGGGGGAVRRCSEVPDDCWGRARPLCATHYPPQQ